MEFMCLYLSAVLLLLFLVILVTLVVYLSIKGLVYIMGIWFGSHDSDERR